ncbi:DUF7115 domain-containing protein [Natrarchaeobaculum aegyptiacum]|uniref:DUF7115 domain-containing protein n=1 Tax=Natrarchaeobaculum aegyptiacum TaxID=745377 RepID=A0A2Z2HNE3_9EURY|nr:hypothetical protein [Natrarchaeobaculum aegyptiacum]ARS88420.1 hypothetical protein B1756_00730 [Natrarchaeobaculum aegyptiacum]
MSVPGIVQSSLGDEEIAARVPLGGEDELFITPTRTLVYRAEGLLSDESVEEFPHGADRLVLSEGRRKTKFTLEYPLEGTKEFTIPAKKTDAALHPVLAGVLNGNEITDPGETVVQTYRFSELTLIVTSERLVKHIGSAVWDDEYEEYHFADVTKLTFEAGSVATQIVLEVDGRPQRIKAPNEDADDLRERLKRALFEFHDVDSLEELNALNADDDDGDDEEPRAAMDFGEGVEPLDANPPEPDDEVLENVADESPDAELRDRDVAQAADAGAEASATTAGSAASGSGSGEDRSVAAESWTNDSRTAGRDDGAQTATVETGNVFEAEPDLDGETASTPIDDDQSDSVAVDPVILERLETLEAAVERQTAQIEAQQETIEQLIAELRQGR